MALGVYDMWFVFGYVLRSTSALRHFFQRGTTCMFWDQPKGLARSTAFYPRPPQHRQRRQRLTFLQINKEMETDPLRDYCPLYRGLYQLPFQIAGGYPAWDSQNDLDHYSPWASTMCVYIYIYMCVCVCV